MSRTVLVGPESPILRHASTRVLNQYPNHAALVETDAPAPETGPADEVPAAAGLKLDTASDGGTIGSQPAAEGDNDLSAYIEFIGQIDQRWLAQLDALGIRVLAYQPESTYLCFGPDSAFRAALDEVKTTSGASAIRRITQQSAGLKKQLRQPSEDGERVVIVVAATPDERGNMIHQLEAVPGVDLLAGAGNDQLDANRLRLLARIADSNAQSALLRLPRVLSVERFQSPRAEDEIAGLIIAGRYDMANRPAGSYLEWLQDHSIDGKGVTIGIVDGGVDVDHPAFGARARDLAAGQKDWHATMVAGHAAGNYLAEADPDQFIYGLGTAPEATILSQDKMQAATAICRQTVTEAGGPGAIQNNSWGKETRSPMDYGSDEALYDALVRNADPQGAQALPLTICFSSGNSGPLGLTRPKAAKNVIVTGNSENFRPDIGHDGSNNINEVYTGAHGSSYGNCGDGRIRPHVVAPGEWTASANYDCHVGEDEYISPRLTWGGGSSGASPKTAGACALLTDWWRRGHGGDSPSPAMLRALIVNGAEPIDTGGPVPNPRQGWGRLNVQNILDPSIARILVDQAGVLSHPNDVREWHIRAADPGRPVKITLAWTDPPGAVGSGGAPDVSPVVNKLALRAEVGAQIYRGAHDRFRNSYSASDDAIAAEGTGAGIAEGSDNLQNIFLPADAATGTIRVSVTALNLTTNCLNGAFDTPQQDFALVLGNASLDASAIPSGVLVTVDAAANGAPPAPGGSGYWSAASGNGDGDLAGPAPGRSVAPAKAPDAKPNGTGNGNGNGNGMPSSNSSLQEDNAWWAGGGDPDWAAPESTRAAAPPTGDPGFAAHLDAGFVLLAAGGHQPQTIGTTDPMAPPAARAVLPLSLAIAGLRERFASARAGGLPCCAVLAMGAGTRVNLDDMIGLRALALDGTLWLVSDNPGLFSFLAQRIGCHARVHYRLARDRAELAELVLDTLAEAGGLQPLALAGPGPVPGPAPAAQAWQFDVVAEDRAIVIHIRFGRGAAPTRVRLARPGAPDLTWSPQAPLPPDPTDVAVGVHDGLLQIHGLQAFRHAGAWTVEITAAGADPQPSLKAWALGGPSIAVGQNALGPAAESAQAREPRLLRLSAQAGTSLLRASIPPPRIAAPDNIAGEAGRAVVLQVRRSRLDSGGAQVPEDDRRPLPVPSLTHVVPVPVSGLGASVLDLPIDVAGVNAAGQHFARRIRTNLLRLCPGPEWRREARAAAAKVFYTRGQIAEMKLQKGLITSLRLSRGFVSRTVQVSSAILGRQLAQLDAETIRGHTFIFGVRGGELISVFSPPASGFGAARDDERRVSPVGISDWDSLMSMLTTGAPLPRPGGGAGREQPGG
jgi:hypothetical protein